ncbi:chemotaxis protein CheA [Jutongia hominis]|uniref:Chemotaxis protein CheA n=1 Tax=Jutongia hominis TaxID=2763664 RepID=A0ABR7MVT8_9FIRM|nr:chemotaxis protein CheA [Jutongia hominis]MBC8557916.1 chemotaxis protein CheA [Jutongia hominis]
MDVSQYLEIFIDETKEHLQTLSDQLMILEQEPENMDTINEIFRAAHSLKGMAGTMGYKRMQRLTHDMENVFQEIRSGNMKVQPELIDVLFRGLDALEAYLAEILESGNEGTEENEEIINTLNSIAAKATGKEPPEPMKTAQPQETASASTEEAPAEAKYTSIQINDYEKNTFDKAVQQKENIFGITVYLQETCILKAARAFLVFKALEEHGEVIKAVPNVQDIEDEKFDFDFSLVYFTKDSAETIKKAIENVSEVKKAIVGAFMPEMEKSEESEKHDTPKEVKKDEKAVNNAGAAQQTVKKAENKKAAKKNTKTTKPTVGRTVRVDIEKLDVLMNLVSELIIAKNGLVSMSSSDDSKKDSGFNEQIEYLESVTTNLHESVMKVRMVPIESVVSRFPRMIRDLNKKLNKKMELHMTGEETELDRTVIDEIGDPLQHLLRNAADHGLESNEERLALGKEEVGQIYLDAYQDGNNVNIVVRDDGAGIDVEKVKQKAIEKGNITPEQAEIMTDKDVIDLLFKPSFSTAEKITDVSGRGVGLDVVKTKIEGLGGNIECKTVLGEGSSFIIRLPLTLAIIQALMVELGKEKYAIPLGSIQTIEDIPVSDVKHVQTKEVINLRGTVIPLIRLDQILDVETNEEEPESLTVVIVKKGDKQAGLVVDNLIGQQEIVIKSIGDYINCSKLIGGATILGDGEIALILEVNTLV